MHSCLLKILPTKYIFNRNWILYILDSIYIQDKLSTRTICPWTNLKRHVLHLLDTVFLAEKKTGYFLVIQDKCMVSNQSRLAQINYIFKLVWSFYFIFWLFACLVRALHVMNNSWTIMFYCKDPDGPGIIRAGPRHHPGWTRTPEVLLKWSGQSWNWKQLLETRWIPKVTEFTSQRKPTSLWCN